MASVRSRPVARLRLKHRLDGRQYVQPHRLPVEVAPVEHGVGVHGGEYQGLGAVLLHEQVSAAVDVEVGKRDEAKID